MLIKFFNRFVDEIIRAKKDLFTKDSFTQDFAFVFSGRAIGVLSQVIFAPLLARVYGPEVYGVFSVFNAILMNVSIVATLRLEGALILPKSEDEFNRLLKSAFFIILAFSGLILLATLFGKERLSELLGFKNETYVISLLAPFVFLTGLYQLTSNWVVRKKEFKKAFRYETPVGILTKIVNLVYGVITKGAVHGLLFADAFLKIASIFFRMKYILKTNFSFLNTSLTWNDFKKTINHYRQFPLFNMPANWLFMISSQLPVYLIVSNFDINSVGQIGFALNLLEVPLTLLSNSIGPVFLQKIAGISNSNSQEVKRLVYSLQKKLLYIGVLPFTCTVVFGDKLFAFVFGHRWEPAGQFTSCLAIYYLFRLVSSPLSSVFIIYKQQNKIFNFHLFLLIARLLALSSGIFLFHSIFWAILFYSIVSAIGYFYFSGLVLRFVQVAAAPFLVKSVGLITFCVAGFYLIRVLIF